MTKEGSVTDGKRPRISRDMGKFGAGARGKKAGAPPAPETRPDRNPPSGGGGRG